MGLEQKITAFKNETDMWKIVDLDDEANEFESTRLLALSVSAEKIRDKIADLETNAETRVWDGWKFSALQGWVEDKNYGEDINCRRVTIDGEELHSDIKAKLAALRSKDSNPNNPDLKILPPTFGFLYGSQEEDECYVAALEELDEFLDSVLEKFGALHLVYWCWY